MKKIDLLGISVSKGTYKEFLHELIHAAQQELGQYACVANVHMLVEAHRDKNFAHIVRQAGFITPDGKPLSWALRILYGIKQDRVAGMDLLPDLLNEAESKKIPVYFYGGKQIDLDRTGEFISRNYPQLIVAGSYSPPFRNLTSSEEEEIVKQINGSGAKLVFVVLGCPKQEKWMASMQGKIKALMIGVGGALPVMIGVQKRAPLWMQRFGLEWFYRLMQEPGRLFKRYAVTNSTFLYLLLKEYLLGKKISGTIS